MTVSNKNIISTIFFFLASFTIIFWNEWVDLFALWNESIAYSHGFLVFATSVYLTFRLHRELLASIGRPSIILLFGSLALSFLIVLSQAADIQLTRLTLLPPLIIATGGAIFGWQFARALLLPIGILLFAMPFWDDLSLPLQLITVYFNDLLLSIFNIPAKIYSLYIEIPQGTFFVAGGCSGVRYLMVSMFLSTVFSFLYIPGKKRKAIAIATSAFLAMLSNWVRVFFIILAGYSTNMESSLINDHEWFGWVIFVIFTLVPLLFILNKLSPSSFNYDILKVSSEMAIKKRFDLSIPVLAIVILFSFGGPVALMLNQPQQDTSTSKRKLSLPVITQEWIGPLIEKSNWEPKFHNTDYHLTGRYLSRIKEEVYVDIVGYFQESQDKELVYFKNKMFDSNDWQQYTKTVLPLNTVDNQTENTKPISGPSKVNELTLTHNQTKESRVIWYWYQLDGRSETSTIKAKLLGGLNKLLGNTGGSVFSLSTKCENIKACQAKRSSLNNAVDQLSPKLVQFIQEEQLTFKKTLQN